MLYNKDMKKHTILIILAVIILLGIVECPIYNILGLPCAACGMTRAWRLALAGDISGAFLMHPLFLMPVLLIFPAFRKKCVLIVMAAVMLLVYIIRMVIMFPEVEPMIFNQNNIIGEILK